MPEVTMCHQAILDSERRLRLACTAYLSHQDQRQQHEVPSDCQQGEIFEAKTSRMSSYCWVLRPVQLFAVMVQVGDQGKLK